MEIGPQSTSGSAFTRRMRFHQSWYRSQVLGLVCGTGPYRTSANNLGNMLCQRDAEAGKNFLTAAIHRVVKERLRANPAKVERYRVLHNMLSSQPMCFNLFGPMVGDTALATKLARALLGAQVHNVTRVIIEWAPSPAAAYLNDNTSFDAFIEYERAGGGLGFAGIETKLTEPFSQHHYDDERYRKWMGPGSPWLDSASECVSAVDNNQLWRNHLLVWSMLQRSGSPYREGRVVVVRHPLDNKCAGIVGAYSKLLRDSATFLDAPLDALVKTWQTSLRNNSTWLGDFEQRYLDLASSANAWQAHQQRG